MTWGGERLEHSHGVPERVFHGGYLPHGIGILLREFMGVEPPMKSEQIKEEIRNALK